MINHDTILRNLFRVCGPSNLALQLDISKQAVHQWKKVPAMRARAVEEITGIPREDLRPDIFGGME